MSTIDKAASTIDGLSSVDPSWTVKHIVHFVSVFLVAKCTTQWPTRHETKSTCFVDLVKPKQAASGRALPAGPSGGASGEAPSPAGGAQGSRPKPPVHWSGPVYWHMTLPVHTVLARATRAQPYFFCTFLTLYCHLTFSRLYLLYLVT